MFDVSPPAAAGECLSFTVQKDAGSDIPHANFLYGLIPVWRRCEVKIEAKVKKKKS